LQEEQQYLLEFKILESKHLILDIKNEFYKNKIKYLIKEFNQELFEKIFEFTKLEKNINETLGNLEF
jgi:hypothetical protein